MPNVTNLPVRKYLQFKSDEPHLEPEDANRGILNLIDRGIGKTKSLFFHNVQGVVITPV